MEIKADSDGRRFSRFGAADSDAVSVCLISRKSIANPGTRYNARGLNGVGGAGNEIESELITWWEDGQAGVGRFSTLLCRRGTVPVNWKHELHSSVSQPKIVISEAPYDGRIHVRPATSTHHVPMCVTLCQFRFLARASALEAFRHDDMARCFLVGRRGRVL